MSNMTINVCVDGQIEKDPKIIAERIKENMRMLTAPDEAEAELKIRNSLKGLTRREAMRLLSKVSSDIIDNTYHESTLDDLYRSSNVIQPKESQWVKTNLPS